ncbi:choice-of-anchor M domain-containing protein [Corynebacterium pseudodiphtheriticum]|uniref:choice-of-anchor M domain-containing protein n=1 Tax=Corynebacterium pseudodiphtheriticum TaxID=37637 RepID=UPI0025439D76|nr:choice-of-anchor M domain-containing protein [Corynebacterium pseudodiphtheriticum]MDK4328324.1 choice-of-anchor M domain-containing protein [Corynebacterium pseudodiphtheriticum]
MKTSDFSRADVRAQGRRFTVPGSRRSRIRIAVAVTAALSAAFASLPAAQAGPDDGKLILTERHIDSPYVVSKDGQFDARTKYNQIVDGDYEATTAAFADSALWIGKGWDDEAKTKPKYQITLPDNGDFAFIGEPGETYVQAPSGATGSNHKPIWYGFGAESGLDVSNVQNGRVALDLIGIDGPGDMEQYNYNPNDVFNLARVVGTTQSSSHSISIKPAEHTHLNTLFTKPGRYELTYRVSSRTNDGKFITSEPRTQVIQVGGQRPLDTPTESVEDRFKKAPQGDAAAANYRLTIAPKSEPKAGGDDKLSTITFDAGKEGLNGTVTLFVDGYFLTDLAVENGKATWDELLSPKQSNIQAVFTPDAVVAGESTVQGAGEGAAAVAGTAPRWISAPLPYSAGESKETTSAQHADALPKGNNKRDLRTPEPGTQLTSKDVDVRYVSGDGLTDTYYVEAKDPTFQGAFTGGVYSTMKDTEGGYADLPLEGAIVNGKGFVTIDKTYAPREGVLFMNVIPHPGYGIANARGAITEKFIRGNSYEGTVHFGESPGVPESVPGASDDAGQQPPADKPSEVPNPPESSENPGVPEGQTPSQQGRGVCVGKKLLDRGHVDILAKHNADGFDISLKDDTRLIDKKSVERALNEVALVVGDNTKETRRAAHQGAEFDFLGKQDDGFYHLPQTQRPGVIWPGYNTEAIDFNKIDGDVSLNLQPRDVPEGATWGTFIDGRLGEAPTVLSDSTKNDHSIESSFASHTHIHWGFSKPGVYIFDANYSAKGKDGREVKSESQEFVITVGKDAKETCTAPKPGAGQEPNQPEVPGNPDAPKQPEESIKPEAPKDPETPKDPKPGQPEKPQPPKQPETPKKPEKPEAPKKPGNQSKPGGWSPQNFFSNFNPVHLLAPVLGIVFIARMVALFFELQPQVANFFAQGIPGLPKWGK